MLVIDSDCFTWHPDLGTFAAEASDLDYQLMRQGRRGLDYRGGQWGFHMRSLRTGKLLWFQRINEERDRENELQAVVFSASLTPNRTLRLRVFND